MNCVESDCILESNLEEELDEAVIRGFHLKQAGFGEALNKKHCPSPYGRG
jgi:hypothetical protein